VGYNNREDESFLDIENRFNYHAPSGDSVVRHEMIRSDCRALAHRLNADLPASREKALALTKLEEAMFWANAAIARN
jgi:hypothetical protein